jgi:hypothetical protein
MQSPDRIERIFSPPQVSVKVEDEDESNNTLRSLILAPFATLKSLVLIKDIILEARILKLDNNHNENVIYQNYNNYSNIN